MKRFKDYLVTLHDPHKRAKQMKVRKCVSPGAACRVATLLERMRDNQGFRGTMAYLLDSNDKPIYQ